MEAVELQAQLRNEAGKGNSKKMRNKGLLPAILYGKKLGSLPIAVKDNEFERLLNNYGENCLVKLVVENEGEEKEYNTLIREIQRHPVKQEFVHVDFYHVSMEDKLETPVTVNLVGEPVGVKNGGILQHGAREVQVKCLPINIPEDIEVDVSGLEIGDNITVSDLDLGEDIEIITEGDTVLATVVPPAKEEAEKPEEVEEAEEAVETETTEEEEE